MVGWFIFGEVRVVTPHEVGALHLLTLLYVLAGMASQLNMSINMVWYAQQSAVVHIIGQPFHLLNGAASLHGHNVVAVNARCYDAILQALLA